MHVPFFRPQLGSEEIDEVADSLRNGWLTTGPKTKSLEDRFKKFLGQDDLNLVAVNSATAGLHLALEAIGIGPGDEVIVPTYTFTATAEVVRYVGAEPVFIDVDRVSLNITAELAEAAITARTKAIMPVHFAGLPCSMEALIHLARTHDLRIVEDAAHALPAYIDGQLVGTLDTTATVFSFYANKTMTTGEGGILATRDPELASRAMKMRLHGMDRDAIDRFRTGRWAYDVIAPGFKYNMTDIAASIGIHQLAKVDHFRQQRAAIASVYNDRLGNLPIDLPAGTTDSLEHAWHLYVIRLHRDAPMSRDELFEALLARGIVCSVHYTPLHRFTYWRDRYNLQPENFPNSEEAFRGALTLPLFPGMTSDEVEYVIECLHELLCPRS